MRHARARSVQTEIMHGGNGTRTRVLSRECHSRVSAGRREGIGVPCDDLIFVLSTLQSVSENKQQMKTNQGLGTQSFTHGCLKPDIEAPEFARRVII